MKQSFYPRFLEFQAKHQFNSQFRHVRWDRLDAIFKNFTDGCTLFKSELLEESSFERMVAIEVMKNSLEKANRLQKWIQTKFSYFEGDLVVNDHLSNIGVLVVEGNLTIHGNYFNGSGGFTSVVVGGKLEAENMITSGEVISAGGIYLKGLGFFHYNDHSTLSPYLKCTVLIEDDRENFISNIDTSYRFKNKFRDEDLEKFFGVKELPGNPEEDNLLLAFLYKKAASETQILALRK